MKFTCIGWQTMIWRKIMKVYNYDTLEKEAELYRKLLLKFGR